MVAPNTMRPQRAVRRAGIRWVPILATTLGVVALGVAWMGFNFHREALRLEESLRVQAAQQEHQARALSSELVEVGRLLSALVHSRDQGEVVLGGLVERCLDMTRYHDALQGRVDDLGQEIHDLTEHLDGLANAQDATRSTVSRLEAKSQVLDGVLRDERQNLVSLQSAMGEAQKALVQSEVELKRVQEASLHLVDQVADDLAGRFENRMTEIQDEYGRLAASLAPTDRESMVARMVLPTVRVSCDQEVGSGTIIASTSDAQGAYHSFVLTALHVVAAADGRVPVEITLFDGDGNQMETLQARVVSMRDAMDLALLELETAEPLPRVAVLASTDRLEQVQVFTPVYAVGCPLGYPPLPTVGEVSSRSKILAGERYWMINAPTIFGNSGGGIFLSESHELIGVLSRVSAYNNFINIAVPHMGIMVPASALYPWLEEEEYRFILDPGASYEDCASRREQLRQRRARLTKDAGSVRAVLR